MRIVSDVGRKAARAYARTRTRLGYLGKLFTLARSLARRRKVDNVTRVPIVIKPTRRSIARARLFGVYGIALAPIRRLPSRGATVRRRAVRG